jgi:6-pyruvoyltetrahydropterin/6-carboxytetrahydropterin synthase
VISRTRRYRFPAAHALRREDLPEQENRRLYGKCANPRGHGHDYAVEVTVSGPPDPLTGRVVDPARLDRAVEERLLRRFSHRLLNEDPLFAERVPTAENIARAAHALLREPVAALGARLRRVRVRETRNNTFDYGDDR